MRARAHLPALSDGLAADVRQVPHSAELHAVRPHRAAL